MRTNVWSSECFYTMAHSVVRLPGQEKSCVRNDLLTAGIFWEEVHNEKARTLCLHKGFYKNDSDYSKSRFPKPCKLDVSLETNYIMLVVTNITPSFI